MTLDELADAELDADRDFFAKHPDTKVRTRRAFPNESEQAFGAGQPRPADGCALYVCVRAVRPGVRMREFFVAETGAFQ
jgi:hypothetical protein